MSALPITRRHAGMSHDGATCHFMRLLHDISIFVGVSTMTIRRGRGLSSRDAAILAVLSLYIASETLIAHDKK